jgi:hypothetical protein
MLDGGAGLGTRQVLLIAAFAALVGAAVVVGLATRALPAEFRERLVILVAATTAVQRWHSLRMCRGRWRGLRCLLEAGGPLLVAVLLVFVPFFRHG